MVDPKASRFWQAARQSGLIDEEGLQACLAAIPPEKREGRAARPPPGAAGGPAGQALALAGSAAHGGPVVGLQDQPLHADRDDRPGGDGPGLPGQGHPAEPPGGAEDPLTRTDEQSPRHRPVPARGAGRGAAPAREPRPDLRRGRGQRQVLPRDGVHRGEEHRRDHRRERPDPCGHRRSAGAAGRRSDWSTPSRKG